MLLPKSGDHKKNPKPGTEYRGRKWKWLCPGSRFVTISLSLFLFLPPHFMSFAPTNYWLLQGFLFVEHCCKKCFHFACSGNPRLEWKINFIFWKFFDNTYLICYREWVHKFFSLQHPNNIAGIYNIETEKTY